MLSLRRLTAGFLGLALLALVATADTTPAPKAVSEDDAKWLLGDAEAVFKINVKQLLASDLMKGGGAAMVKDLINGNEQVKTLLNAAGLDVTKDVDTVLASVAGGANPADAKMLVVIRGRFDPAKIEGVIAKDHKEIKILKEGTTKLFEVPVENQTLFAAFADKDTMVMTQSKDSTIETLKSGGKKAAPMSKDMKSALSKFKGNETLAVAMVVTEDIKKGLGGIPGAGATIAKLQTVTAAITMTNEVDLAVRGITTDAKAAGQISKQLEALKATAALAGDEVPKFALEIIDAIKLVADKETVKIDLKVTKELIEKAKMGG